MCVKTPPENELRQKNSTQWWEKDEVRFECRQCGKCCGGEPGAIWLTVEEKQRIAAFLELSEGEFAARYLTRSMGRSSIRELENYDCMFLERNQMRCSIYKVRPLQCQLFPFWPSILRDKNVWNFYAKRCVGMNQGKLYTVEMIKEIQKEVIWQDL